MLSALPIQSTGTFILNKYLSYRKKLATASFSANGSIGSNGKTLNGTERNHNTIKLKLIILLLF